MAGRGWIPHFLRVASIVLVGIAVGLCYNRFSGHGIPLRASPVLPPVVREAWLLRMEGLLVTTLEAKEALGRGGVVFLDARAPVAYVEGHIPSAISLPYVFFQSGSHDIPAELDRSTPIITYCYGPSCQSSVKLARLLREQRGFIDVRALFEGIPGWVANGFPLRRGDRP